jgi:hypothetical protein
MELYGAPTARKVVTVIFACLLTALKLEDDIWRGEAFLDKVVLQDTLGFILIILILLEFNHSIWVALTERSGAIQVRILVRITILVIVRNADGLHSGKCGNHAGIRGVAARFGRALLADLRWRSAAVSRRSGNHTG